MTEKSRKQSETPIPAPWMQVVGKGKVKTQRQGKPDSPGDRLAILTVG
jgi:hypothetical protein